MFLCKVLVVVTKQSLLKLLPVTFSPHLSLLLASNSFKSILRRIQSKSSIPSKWGFRQFVVKWAYPMMLTSKNWSDDQKLSNAEVNSICQEAGMLAARDNRYEVWIIPFDKFDGRLIINRWLMNFRMWKKPTQIKSRIMTKCYSNIIII